MRRPLVLACAVVTVAACGGAVSPSPAAPTHLTVLAAASLKNALAKVKTTYEAAYPSIVLDVSTDSSTALETKIEQGQAADVFLSADTANPQKLVDKSLAGSAPTKFATNKPTVIVPTANTAGIVSPKDLARAGIKIVAAADTVPITKYATQLVQNLAKQPDYPTDFEARYNANVIARLENVGAVVAQIAADTDGDAAIVYVTDAKGNAKVSPITVPDAANVPATYAGVTIKDSAHGWDAAAFLTWFSGPAGQAILADFGFLPPS